MIKRIFGYAPLAVVLPLCPSPLAAQDTLPETTQEISDRMVPEGSDPFVVDLTGVFAISGVTGNVIQFDSNFGSYNLELFPTVTPGTVANFLQYVGDGDYINSIVHRSALTNVDNVQVPFVIQGGGFTNTFGGQFLLDTIAANPPIVNEFNLSNTRGTIAMAKTANPDSATSQWFINLRDNIALDNPSNSGGFTVFGRVIGSGMEVVDAIAALRIFNLDGGTFSSVPLTDDFPGFGLPTASQWVTMSSIETIPIFPEANSSKSVLNFSITENSNPGLITASITHSEMQVASIPGQAGFADLTVRATDTNGNTADASFRVEVTQTNSMRWLRTYFTDVQIEAGLDTSDDIDMTGDGITNLLAYAFNLDPRIFHRDLLPAPNIDGANRLTFGFVRDTRATDLTYRVEAGPAPGSLQTIAQSSGGSVPSGSGVITESGGSTTRTVTVSDTVTAEQSQIRFMRLVVTRD